MAIEVASVNVSASGAVAILGDLKTYLTGAKLKLYQSSFTPNPGSVVGDFAAAEANYTGYAAQVVTWSAVGVQADDTGSFIGNRSFFQATDAVAPNQIGGAWLENAGGDLLGYFPFAEPRDLSTALAWLAVTPTWTFPGSPSAVVEG